MNYDKTPKQHLNEILGARDTMHAPSLADQVFDAIQASSLLAQGGTIQASRTTDHGSRADDRQVGGTHYRNMDVSPWDVIDSWPREQRIGAYRAGALKYLMRMGSKDESPQEIAKGIHYMEKLLDTLQQP
jgi:hypothetical protein